MQTAIPASDHYAEAFTTLPGRCFRFVHNSTGHAQHCPFPAVRAGEFTDMGGRRWRVEACAGHASDLAGDPRSSGQ